MIELLPCPFCGDEDFDIHQPNGDDKNTHNQFYILCNGCEIVGRSCSSKKVAIKEWNTRASLNEEINYLSGYKDGYQEAINRMVKFAAGEENEKKD